MQLSIYNIYEKICIENCCLKTEEKITFDLSGVRIYAEHCEALSKSILYIIYPQQLKNIIPDKSLHFLCIGFIDEEYIDQKFQSVILMPEQGEIYHILSSIQDIFDSYHQWMESVNQAILQGKSLQTIFDLCSLFLRNPVALFDNSQSLLLKSGHIPENIEDSLWGFVLKNGYSPKEVSFENNYVATQLQSNPMPFYYKSNDRYRNINRLIAGIHINDTPFGCIATTDINAPITSMEYANLHFIQKFMESALLNSEKYQSYVSETPWYINQLLRGEHIEKSVLSYNLSLKGRRTEDKFYLWCFRPLSHISTDKFSIKSYLLNFNRFFKTDMLFCHENQIVIFDYNLESYNDTKHHLNLTDFLSTISFKGAFSMVFSNLLEMHQAYMQCQITLENTNSECATVYSFQKHYSSYILELFKKNSPWDSLLYPGIKHLLTKDKKYGVELLRCLQTFIMQGRNITATADHLFVHRHTVIYRLNCISKIMQIDLKDLDDYSLFHLFLSCGLLLHSEQSNIQA
ncbi:helix-turn-helix domain-containing protein [Clostridium sp. A1-XYC3]|uniref:Helix-turn-helix domain-containing protein n=1 Tax=Clostridium tanneri TaxID=3037988 RepID=A0ABU4JY67_9CLOT|nr:helix-turn-helix domain-containing protein [Clostridium sp. A1-XYC3]MDW8803125.1 helix-turn-helix domain-containing protein [Clostridium sp. A1-XYC3]